MDFNNIKKPLALYLIMVVLFVVYVLLFGTKNLVIPFIVLLATLFTIRSDYSLNPKFSFLKILLMFWAGAIVAYINTPNNILGLILGFLLIFQIARSSYSVLTSDSYIAYVMCYLMMLSSPVTIEQLPIRLLALGAGALIIVAANLYIHNYRHYHNKGDLANSLLDELMNVVDAKLNNTDYESFIPKINDNVNVTLFENIGHKIINNYARESLTTICKTAYYIFNAINKNNFTQKELKRIKSGITEVKNNEKIVRCGDESEQLSLLLLNLEIISSEMNSMASDRDNTYDFSIFTSFVKNNFSFSYFEILFALKLAFIISLWELLGLLFNLPYVQWLYFSSLPLLTPYVEEVTRKSKIRLKSTVIGAIIFIIVLVLLFGNYSIFNLLNISVPESMLSIVFILVLLFFMVLFFKDMSKRTVFTTLLSLMMSHRYLTVNMAVSLRVLWLTVAAIVAIVMTKYVMPYSIRNETLKSLNIRKKLNEGIIDLLKKQLNDEKILSKAGSIVSSSILGNYIQSNNESLQDSMIGEVNIIQDRIMVLCDFMLNYIQRYKINWKSKERIYNILLENEVIVTDDMSYEEKLSINITKDILNLKQDEEESLTILNNRM